MPTPASIKRTYLSLEFGNTLAASFIWGINTIFLLDAGLSNLEAFAANAFFTAGMVLFEVPTGVIADTVGRRFSYLLGTVTLSASTLLYVLLSQVEAPFWQWAVVSIMIGLGYTFFSGAVEAWLVDALTATGFTGEMESVFGRGEIVAGGAMLVGSVAGGYIAQQTSLGSPAASASTASTRCSPICSNSTGTRTPTRSPVLSPQPWPALRFSVGWRRPGSAGCFAAARLR